jgi:hypothetical protein
MLVLQIVTLLLGAGAALHDSTAADSTRARDPRPSAAVARSVVDSLHAPEAADSRIAARPLPSTWRGPIVLAPLDTPVRRRRVVELSDWYGRRLMVHRITAYTIPALFAWQWYKGDQLMDRARGDRAFDSDPKSGHELGAVMISSAFAINALTGAWNLYEARGTPQGSTARWLHTISMIAAAGGFAYAGLKLTDDIEAAGTFDDAMQARENHRNLALASMGVTVVSGIGMWIANRR